MNNTKQSLIILNYFSETIRLQVDTLHYCSVFVNKSMKVDDVLNDIFFQTFKRIIALDCCSFLDEYNNFFGVQTDEKDKEDIALVKKICKPFILQLKKWNDLNEYRNTLVAHNFRGKNKQLVLLNTKLNRNKIPKSILDLIVLRNCIIFTMNIIRQEFSVILSEAIEELEKVEFEENLNSSINHDNFDELNISIINESKKIAYLLNKKYNYDMKL